MSLAHLIHERYEAFNDDEKLEFFMSLVEEMDVQLDVALAALKNYRGDPSVDNYEKLIRYFETGRLQLIRRLNQAHNATAKLVKMREDLTRFLLRNPELKKLDIDFKNLFISWFNRGFLVLRPINWSSPAHILEKIITYESVHEIRSWDDLRRRLQPEDRRCFAFFHPRMPEEPLIFVWVALFEGMAGNIQDLLDEDAPIQNVESADTAIFYSISNAQFGLSGINFGNFLIKRVVDSLRTELRGIRTFATLSPIPGFMPWLRRRLREKDFNFLTREQEESLVSLSSKSVNQTASEALEHFLFRTKWHDREDVQSALRPILLKLAAHYLVNEKRTGGTAVDSVAHFHLNNGSRIEQLHWNADTSARGLEQSAGIMLNYRYLLDDIDANHESYRSGGEIVTSSSVRALLKD